MSVAQGSSFIRGAEICFGRHSQDAIDVPAAVATLLHAFHFDVAGWTSSMTSPMTALRVLTEDDIEHLVK